MLNTHVWLSPIETCETEMSTSTDVLLVVLLEMGNEVDETGGTLVTSLGGAIEGVVLKGNEEIGAREGAVYTEPMLAIDTNELEVIVESLKVVGALIAIDVDVTS